MNQKLKILFLCTGNSCRSQMAEGWTKYLKSGLIDAYSAGVEVHGMNVLAVQVMAEAGVDISQQHSKHIRDLLAIPFDYVITVCNNVNETCPIFPGKAIRVHISFDDPPQIAKSLKSNADILAVYRRVRDEIQRLVETLPDALPGFLEEK
ncbi:MAG TPA: arsenate reductase ArsC [Chitinispirillaceae bacterium]|nr:arsenate reductase ArsC [Chitinispirillaceae bacterium]